MDFFEAQARAKKRTARLVWLFAAAVLGTIVTGYFAALLLLRQLADARATDPEIGPSSNSSQALWDPQLLAWVAVGTLAVVIVASLYKWAQFSSGGGAVAENLGGRHVDPHTTDLKERQLLNVVEEMAIASGTPVPAVFVLDDEPAINAFAAGLTTSDAAVAVTRGTLEKLTRDELQAVIGHEFSHILNGDMRLNLRIAATVFGILVIGLAGRSILWSLRHTRVRSSRDKNSGGVLAAIAALGVALMIVGYVGYFFGRLIQAAVSRQREFLADASAVQFTRNPGGLTGALKKIGGYALGSTMQSSKSAEIGHFFFAQAFRSGLTGLWSTHPPLPERLRAIDPQFDGQMFEPPQVVDIARESFQAAGFQGGPRLTPDEAARQAFSPAETPPPRPAPARIPFQPATLAATIGTLTPSQLASAHDLLEAIPIRLRDAAHHPDEVAALVFGLLLDDDPAIRARQRQLVSARATTASPALRELEAWLHRLSAAQKIPLLQLALPAIRQLPPAALEPLLDTLDELVHADAHVSPFEFALQKLLVRTLELGRSPGSAKVAYHSFNAVVGELSTMLSVLARAATTRPDAAATAFAAGAAHLKLVEARLGYQDESTATLAALDAALDKLAVASLPIKQRALIAAAHVVGADGQIGVAEAELLRAISAALDVPMPPLSPSGEAPMPT